jgi:hypothetical protein
VIQIKAKRAELALRPSKRQTNSGEEAVWNYKFGRRAKKVNWVGYRIQNPNRRAKERGDCELETFGRREESPEEGQAAWAV